MITSEASNKIFGTQTKPLMRTKSKQDKNTWKNSYIKSLQLTFVGNSRCGTKNIICLYDSFLMSKNGKGDSVDKNQWVIFSEFPWVLEQNKAYFPWKISNIVHIFSESILKLMVRCRYIEASQLLKISWGATMVGPEGRKFWKSGTWDSKIQAILLKGVWKIKFSDFPWNFFKNLYFPCFPGSVKVKRC